MTDRITIRLGKLAQQLLAAAKAAGVTPIQYARQAIAERLGVAIPSRLPTGFQLPSIKAKAVKTNRARRT